LGATIQQRPRAKLLLYTRNYFFSQNVDGIMA
jgi:hypothetical protein